MPQTFYLADWHYGHANALAFDDRPFKTVEEMNAALIERWNGAVAPEDSVYVLGDMFWSKGDVVLEVLDRLHGHKYLVRGNHDQRNDGKFTGRFARVTEYMEIEDGGRKVVLCHYPMPCFKNHFYGWYHLYGHVHKSFEHNMMENIKRQMRELYDRPCQMYNVGVMMPWIDYTPRTLEHILHHAGPSEIAPAR